MTKARFGPGAPFVFMFWCRSCRAWFSDELDECPVCQKARTQSNPTAFTLGAAKAENLAFARAAGIASDQEVAL
jgi:RNA polymerase subunit RPABC4/transcription elongation factor Spt4